MKKSFILILVLLVMSASAQSQQPGATLLTFEQAVDMTYRQNEELEAVAFARSAAEWEKKAATGLRFPKIGVTATYVHMQKDIGLDFNRLKTNVGGILNELPVQLPTEWSNALLSRDWFIPLQNQDVGIVGGTVTVPIFTGGKINAANRLASIQVKEAELMDDKTREHLYSQLVERYFGLALAQQVVKVRAEVLAGMNQHLSDAVELEKNGIIARAERLYAQIYVAEAQKDYNASVREAETVNTSLSNTVNRAGEYAPATSMFILTSLEGMDYFKMMAQQNNAILREVDLAEQLAGTAVQAQRANFMPEIAALGALDMYHYRVTRAAPRWVVGAGLKWNIFDGLNREFKYSAAKTRVRQVQAMGAKASTDINTLVEKLYNQLLSNGEQVTALDATIEFAEEYLRIKEYAFKEGTATSSDVVDARLNLARAKIERLTAAYSYDVLLAKLLETAGISEHFTQYRNSAAYQPVRYE